MSAPALTHFDPSKPVEIHTDASAVGVAAVLTQQHEDGEHPVAHTSEALNKAQKNYWATELELFAVVIAVENFHYYIGNLPFKVVTDHSAIGALQKTKNPANWLARCIMRLARHNFEVVYGPGRQNCLADALFRFISTSKELVSYLSSVPLFFTGFGTFETPAGRAIVYWDSHDTEKCGQSQTPNAFTVLRGEKQNSSS